MTDIARNLTSLKSRIPDSVKLVAVSKTKPAEDILEAYYSGQKIFGENRVQEILKKKDQLPSDIEWHLIGHLQSNKVRSIVPYVRMIQSVDSFKIISVINTESLKSNRITDCLFELHIAEEETKSGFSMNELDEMFDSQEFNYLRNVRICGVMGMATFTIDESQVRKEFRHLTGYFNTLKEKYFKTDPHFREISMGMSGDFQIAIEEGSTMIRIGSLIFGERELNQL